MLPSYLLSMIAETTVEMEVVQTLEELHDQTAVKQADLLIYIEALGAWIENVEEDEYETWLQTPLESLDNDTWLNHSFNFQVNMLKSYTQHLPLELNMEYQEYLNIRCSMQICCKDWDDFVRISVAIRKLELKKQRQLQQDRDNLEYWYHKIEQVTRDIRDQQTKVLYE